MHYEKSQPTPRVSLETIVYQAQALLDRISPFLRDEYPIEAQRIAYLIASFAEYIHNELTAISSKETDPAPRELSRARSILRIAQRLHALLRYVQASDSKYTPPFIQEALTALTERFVPAHRGSPLALVRPQWAYNLKYVPLSWVLRNEVQLEVLDPDNKLGLIKLDGEAPPEAPHQVADRFLSEVWRAKSDGGSRDIVAHDYGQKAPLQTAVLSFAGLDKDVTFQFPILAHELGHFIDFSQYPAHHADPRVVKASYVSRSEVEQAMKSDADVDRHWKALTTRITVCKREILADLLATRMLGLGFFLAQAEFLSRIFEWPQPRVTESGYPGIAYRLGIVLEELETIPEQGGIGQFLENQKDATGAVGEVARWTIEHLAAWKAKITQGIQDLPPLAELKASPGDALDALAAQAVDRALPQLRAVAAEILPLEKCARLSEDFFQRVFALEEELPPCADGDDSNSFAEIMSAAWIYQLMIGQLRERGKDKPEKRVEEFRKTCRLILKALELAAASRPAYKAGHVQSQDAPPPADHRPGVLGGAEIRSRLALRGEPERLVILPTDLSAVQHASIDVRLGHWFKVARRPRLRSVDLTTEKGKQLATEVAHEELFIPFGQTLTVHPGDFVLGVTLEFLALPNDVMAFVEGRSRVGRTGLIVATATQVAPGFHGCVVLELANAGAVPIQVGPGTSVAQLVLISMASPAPPYGGSSHCQIRP